MVWPGDAAVRDRVSAILRRCPTTSCRFERILAARELVAARVHRTPILTSATAAGVVPGRAGVRLAGGRLYVKAEHLQKTGSFKPRGMTASVAALDRGPAARRASSRCRPATPGRPTPGPAARPAVPTVVVMPAGAVRSKVEACIGYGAEVVLHGEHVGESLARLEEIRDERGLDVRATRSTTRT